MIITTETKNFHRIVYTSFLLFSSFLQPLMAQPAFQWARGMGGPNTDYGYSVAADAQGNVITGGTFQTTADFDPGAGVYTMTAVGSGNAFISKLDASGNFVWAKKFGVTNESGIFAIAVDASGNIYSTGYFFGTVDFDPNGGTANLTAQGNQDVFVCKLDASGNYLWAKQFGGTAYEVGRAIALDASGNVYVSGYFGSTVDFDPGSGSYNLTASGSYDMFACKLDASGNFVLAVNMGGNGMDLSYAMTVDQTNSIYVMGSFLDTADIDPGSGVFQLMAQGNSDIVICKLNSSGAFVWARQFGGKGSEFGTSIRTDAAGNVYSTGYFNDSTDFDPGSPKLMLASKGGDDIFISKLDTSGNLVWVKHIGSIGIDRGTAISLGANGKVHFTGYFGNTADFDPGSGTFSMSPDAGTDIFLCDLDNSGNFQWAGRIGRKGNDRALGLLAEAGTLYLTGVFQDTVDFDPGSSVYMLPSTGGDIFVTKLSYSCSITAQAGIASGISCYGYNNGSAASSVTSGTSPYTYSWSTGATTSGISNLSAGTYTILVTDANGCTSSAGVSLNQPALLNASILSTTAYCGQSNGTASVTPTGGTMPYTYNWSNGATASSLTNLKAGNYTVTITDSNGCIKTRLASIGDYPAGTVNLTSSDVSCSGGSNGSATATIINASGPYTYSWSNGSTKAAINNLSAGNYTVAVTDKYGCVSKATATINQPVSLLASASTAGNSASANVSGGTPPYTYSWSPGGSTAASITGLSAGAYTVTVTDHNGCTATATVSITTGMEDVSSGIRWRVFPNPADRVVKIEFDNNQPGEVLFLVHDRLGREILRVLLPGNKRSAEIETASMEGGVYFIRLICNGVNCRTEKLVLTH